MLLDVLYIVSIYTSLLMSSKLIIPPISAAAEGALYSQIVHGFKTEISAGRLSAGTPLPSFRALAEGLMVSVITVKRAYEELERDGIIYRKQGLGTFVAEGGGDRSREVKAERARELLAEAVKEAKEAGLSAKEILEQLKSIIAENTNV
jgi:GntR family transcriptional regulator